MRKRKSRRTPVNVISIHFSCLISCFFVRQNEPATLPEKITYRDCHRITPASLLCRYLRIPTKPVVAIRHLNSTFRIARVNGAMLTPALITGLHSIYSTSIEYTPNEHTTRLLLYHITKPSAVSNFHFPILDCEANFGMFFAILFLFQIEVNSRPFAILMRCTVKGDSLNIYYKLIFIRETKTR